MFWRAAARRWPQLDDDARILLGPYREPLRLFLLDVQPFPASMALCVLLTGNPADVSNEAMALPYQAGRNAYRLYRFEVPGVSFVLLVGGGIPTEVFEVCAVRRGIIVAGATVDNIRLKAVMHVLKTAKPKGVVAKRWAPQ